MHTEASLRGHPIYFDGMRWRYEDSNEPTIGHWRDRPCGRCERSTTADGHDACLGALPGVSNACCGHGNNGEAYVQFSNGARVSGSDAVEFFAATYPDATGRAPGEVANQ